MPQSDMINPAQGIPTFLLGWTITWTGPKLDPMPDSGCQGLAESWSVEPLLDENLYSRNWMRVKFTSPFSQLDSNQFWGDFVLPGQQVLVPSGVPPYNNLLNNAFVTFDAYSTPGIDVPHSITFPTITSSENNTPLVRVSYQIILSP